MSSHVCSVCGAAIESPTGPCWLCAGSGENSTLHQLPDSSARPPFNPWSVSLQSIFLVVTLLCVSLGTLVQFPALGVLVLVLAVPALVRTLMIGKIWRAAGKRLTTGEQILSLAGSLGVMFLVAVAASTAFLIVCFPLGASQFEYPPSGGNNVLVWASFAAGGAAALATAAGLFNALWYQPLRQWRKQGELPNSRRRVRAFLGTLGTTFAMLAGVAAGTVLLYLAINLVSYLFAFAPNTLFFRVIIFEVLLVGIVAGAAVGWCLGQRWPKFWAIVGTPVIPGLGVWWLFGTFFFWPLLYLPSAVANFVVVLLVPLALAALVASGYATWRVWRWSETREPAEANQAPPA